MKKALILIMTLSFVNCFSSVIYPKSLRLLTQSSTLITYGKVIEIKDFSDRTLPYYYDRIAIIEIIETIKGESSKKIIKVYYNSSHSCAPTPKFEVGKSSLVFLWRSKSIYHVMGFAYGAKTVNDIEYTFVKNRVLEVLEINKNPDENVRYEQLKDWSFRCLQNPITKMDGIWELSRENINVLLNSADKEKLLNILLYKDHIDYKSDFKLSEILVEDYKSEIESYFITNLKTVTETDIIYVFSDFFRYLSHLGDKEKNKEFGAQFDKIIEDDGTGEELMQIRDEFVANITR